MARARVSALSILVVLAVVAVSYQSICHLAFAVSSSPTQRSAVPTGFASAGRKEASLYDAVHEANSNTAAMAGAFLGVVGSVGVATKVAMERSKVSAKANLGSPSLIQVLEQKGLLSTVERLGLLSAAEDAGVGIQTPEQLGLLRLADDLSLLTLAENVLTNGQTPFLLLAASGALGFLTYLDVTAGAFDLQWFIAGVLGAPALALGVAGLVILSIFGGVQRTRNIDTSYQSVQFDGNDFRTQNITESVSIIDTIQRKRILSYLEENGLLSLAASLVSRPLTLTQNLGVLSTLENTRLLSQVESAASDPNSGALFGITSAGALTAALLSYSLIPGTVGQVGAILMLLVALPLGAAGTAFGIIQAPRR